MTFGERYPDIVQLPLLGVGYALVLFYGRQLPRLTPPFESFPWDSITPQLYNWSTLQFGLAVMVLGLALSNRSVVHRFRVFRLSRTQRLGTLGCAVALMLPWIMAITVGPVLRFGDPFPTIWSIAFLIGFGGLGGLLVVAILRLGEAYVMSSDRYPYVGVDLSRREAMKGSAITLLGGGAVATSFAVGRVTLGESWPEYHGRAPVTYERDDLRMQAVQDPVRLGESITFEITNTSDDGVVLGCHNPWALQAYEDGNWHHVTWTEGRYYLACATLLDPEATTTATVPLSEDAMTEERSPVNEPTRALTPGTYRLVLLGSNPYLAVNFQVLPAV